MMGMFSPDRLAVLMQRAEIYLPTATGKKKDTVTPSPTPKTKKNTQRIKALSPKVQRDETLEVSQLFSLHFVEVWCMCTGKDVGRFTY